MLVPCVCFERYIIYSFFLLLLFFLSSKLSLSGLEWLMTLRWIVERSSSGSARPSGGHGPPIAGFVMVCPWHPRYLYLTIPSPSLLAAEKKAVWLFLWTRTSSLCSIITLRFSRFCFLVTGSSWNNQWGIDNSQSAADGLRNVPVCCRK